MNQMLEATLGRSRTLLALFFMILFAGLWSYITISRESAPDVKIPLIFVTISQEGISPEDSQRLLLRPLEQQIRTIEGIKEIRGNAYENGGMLIVEFRAGHNVDKARNDVREKVDLAKSKLPTEAKEPIVNELSFSQFPVLVIKLSGDVPPRKLYQISKDLKEEIEARVSSVLSATVVGDREDVVEILVDPAKLETYNITLDAVMALFNRNNLVVSAGTLDTDKGKFSVRVPGLIESVEDMKSVPITVNGDAVVTLADVASLRKTYKDASTFARDRGKSAVAIEVSKRTGENIIETVAAVKAVVSEMQQKWPEQLQIAYAQDQSDQIVDMLRDLQNNLIFAVILVMAVIVIALGWRSAVLVGLSVPGAFLAGVLVLDLLGMTLNIVVLFSLILSVGMLVDGAIIVVEYADRKMMEDVPRKEAFIQAAQRMAWPVIVSIATILVVFLPLLFWPGVVGQFMKYLPITLLAVLTASILMALLFVPALGFYLGGISKEHAQHYKEMIVTTEEGDLTQLKGFTGWYFQILEKSLNHSKAVLAGSFGLLVGVIILYSFLGVGVEFFPNVEPEQAAIHVHARGNLSMKEQDGLVKSVEDRILDMKELKSIYTRVGKPDMSKGGSTGQGGDEAEDTIGVITLEFSDWQTRRKVEDILADILKKTKDIPGIYVEPRADKPGPSHGKPIELNVFSSISGEIPKAVEKIRAHMDQMKGLRDIEDTRPIPGIRWDMNIDRAQAAKFDATVELVGAGIRLVTNGYKVSTYRPDDAIDEVDIVLRYPEAYRTIEQLDKVRVRTQLGLIPISNFVTRTAVPKVGFIQRSNGKEVDNIKADVALGVLPNDKVNEIKTWLKTADLGEHIRVEFKGEDEDQKETGDFLIKAFLLAIAMIVIILVTQFNSFFHACLVMSAVIMSTAGVLMGLIIMQEPFGIVMGGIGIIALAGIIVSNNVILIDTYQHLEKQFTDMKVVVLRTGVQRLRPVILTKLTVILGLLPIMFAMNIDFVKAEITIGAPATQWWIQLSTAIVFGVLFASPLTLIVTPCALWAHAQWQEKRVKKKQARSA
ncbi:Multidrug efflux pump subunit AcrB [Candidatus Bealeia paramacronuclearis]|uniref:Multidrug efflux pump subunit AcrB n=1 Tax=Candidatus Bealeia paramacronuclearis TaxID=1921001 RepID=A0ABZ2C4S7_9PROT|nr:Multidrug efflux pump subunit AcrB [Candidatus Bealeia paramacronuclearis]